MIIYKVGDWVIFTKIAEGMSKPGHLTLNKKYRIVRIRNGDLLYLKGDNGIEDCLFTREVKPCKRSIII